MGKVFEKGEAFTTYTRMTRDGREREFEVSAFPVRDEEGRVAYAVEVVRDVTPLQGTALNRQVGRLFSRDLALSLVFDQILRWASDAGPILLQGEQGTGKKLVAQALHQQGSRGGAFTVFPCLEGSPDGNAAALFGPGGGWEQSARGTLYLDGVTRLGAAAQEGLLRRLTQETGPGSSSPRVIASTREDLCAKVGEGAFRRDLYEAFAARLLSLPPLRQRRRDLPILAQHFIEASRGLHGTRAERLGPDALRELLHYDWSGNVRELEARVEAACLTATGAVIESLDLPVGEERVERLEDLLDRVERSCLADALTRTGGRIQETAGLTGLTLKTLQRKMKKHSLLPRDFRKGAPSS
jgi:DNA-binding NtrC family response regulator